MRGEDTVSSVTLRHTAVTLKQMGRGNPSRKPGAERVWECWLVISGEVGAVGFRAVRMWGTTMGDK